MSPDQAYMENQAKAEEEKLHRKVQGLSDADRKEIYGKGSNKTTEPGLRGTSLMLTAPSYGCGHGCPFLTRMDPSHCCGLLAQVWSCWLLRVKPRTRPVYLLSKYRTFPPPFPSRLSRWALQVGPRPRSLFKCTAGYGPPRGGPL